METSKTNIFLLEKPPYNNLLPEEDSGNDYFTNLVKDEKKIKNNFNGFMVDVQKLQDAGKYSEAFSKYESAKLLTNINEYKKVAKITYKMAETLQMQADSGTEDPRTSLNILDDADYWLKISDQNYESARKKEKALIINKKRGFRIGAKAVMNTFKSSIKSTLNRHS